MSVSSPGSVLLVEDSRSDAALAFLALSQGGLRGVVRRVGDGAEALDAVLGPGSEDLRGLLRLILLDINLPKVGGIELLRSLKEDRRSRRIPVVMLTSSEQVKDVAACYDLGANGYIVKGADFETYTSAVVNAVRYWTGVNTSITECGEVLRPGP
jgi:CheY-like chemotaxis protein